MIKEFFKRIYNLQAVVLVIAFTVSFFACMACSAGLIRLYKSGFEDRKVMQISSYASRISNQLVVTDYLNSTNRTIDNELDVAAELYGGRIIVINSTLNVVYDTFDRANGKTSVVPEMVMAMQGSNTSVFDWESGYGYYAYGIHTENENRIRGCIYFVFSISAEAENLENLGRNINIFSALIVLISLIFAFVAVKLITSASKKNKKALTNISNGRLETKLDEKGPWELRSTAESVNAMLAKVRATEESQQEFVSDVSHELKTPMASMKVLAESLLSQEIDDPALYREFLVDINETIDRENSIIQDLLQLVRMDKKTDVLHVSVCSMNEILNIVLKRVKPLAEEKQITVIYESYREIKAEVDDGKLIMALTNIVENGVKYNKPLGELRVGLNSDSGFCYITVEDTGIGISEEAQAHIFDRFYRVDKARARETGGTGLGLAIARDVINMHNGEIKVYSVEDVGTSFTIRLPLTYRGDDVKKIETFVK